MGNKLLAVLAVTGCLLVFSGPMSAHHSGVIYDREHPVTLTGTVTEFAFVNPHARIVFEVKDENGNSVQWVAESAPPQILFRRGGWDKNTLKPGDQITVTGSPIRNGGKIMSVQRLVGPSGKVLTQGAE